MRNTTGIPNMLRNILLPNTLRNNGVKTEFSVHGTPQQLAKFTDISLELDGVNICPKPEVRNLGAIFNADLTMKQYFKSVCKSAYFESHNINSARRSLAKEASAMVVLCLLCEHFRQVPGYKLSRIW